MLKKGNPVVSNKLRQSAKGQPCTGEIVGVCQGRTDTVVLAHFPSDIAGYKSTDLSSGFLCYDCHLCIDDRSRLSEQDYEFYIRRAMVRTLHVWLEMGLLKVA